MNTIKDLEIGKFFRLARGRKQFEVIKIEEAGFYHRVTVCNRDNQTHKYTYRTTEKVIIFTSEKPLF